AQAKELFDELGSLATNEVKTNGEFVLPGFGKLVLSERKAREGRNPATGETIQIPAKTTLKFRVGKGMKDSVVPKK
ncbi:MAG TPA: HU family DNA-binding protein, partial [Pyrinomonadaceae bacterium]